MFSDINTHMNGICFVWNSEHGETDPADFTKLLHSPWIVSGVRNVASNWLVLSTVWLNIDWG